MLPKDRRAPVSDLFFTLGLFCVFTVCSLLLIAIGLRAYRATVTQLQDTYSTRTALSYVEEKLRQHDTVGGAALVEWQGAPALRLTDTVDGTAYLTYVYADADALYELTVRGDAAADREMGEAVLGVKDFTMQDAGSGFVLLCAADSTGGTAQCLVHLRSAA